MLTRSLLDADRRVALVAPGLVDAMDWDPPSAAPPPAETRWHILAGVGRKS